MSISGTIKRSLRSLSRAPETRTMQKQRIRALVSQEKGWWCAQCLEYDIAVQGRNESELRHELIKVLGTHLVAGAEFGQPAFAGLPQAPENFFQAYSTASGCKQEVTFVEPKDFEATLTKAVAPPDTLPYVVLRVDPVRM
jgi:hypothetical protein